MPLVQTRGAASAQGFGEFARAAVAANYIEEVFSCFLYTGTGASLTITNNIDLSTKGGLTWIKGRSGATGHRLTDTARGVTKSLASNSTAAEVTESTGLTAFGTTGFTIGADADYNTSAETYASWTFRKQPKFFDIVTYTGNGTAGRTVAHNLGAAPGCIIVKRTDTADGWAVYHRSLGATKYIFLNQSNASGTYSGYWNNTEPTSSVFSLGNDAAVNDSGGTYVAYIFAHDAGGFGLTGTDNVISCGSYTGNGSSTGPIVNLGYEPQFIILKAAVGGTSGSQDWNMIDNMRGWTTSSNQQLNPNLSAAETSQNNIALNATGFQPITAASDFNGNGNTYIYISIRRGPMKVPTLGTSVFSPIISSASAGTVLTTNFPIDLQIQSFRSTTGAHRVMDRLRGVSTDATAVGTGLATTNTNAETSPTGTFSLGWNNTSFKMTTSFETTSGVFWNFQRAPSFFDEVCYTGTGVARTISHNLAAVPELMVIKSRTTGGNREWVVYSKSIAIGQYLYFNSDAVGTNTYWNGTAPTASVFSIDGSTLVNNSPPETYVAYLFATCAGVSKVGSYTGNGTTQTIDCGFGSGGARFVLIKRTDATGDWYVYDTARGMTVLTDPYLLLNTTAAEVASLGSVTTVSTGFALDSTILAAINVNTGTYIFLAIA